MIGREDNNNVEKGVENRANSRHQLGKEDMEVEEVWDCVERGCGGTGCGRQSDARGLREFGNLWVRKGRTNCGRVTDSICPLRSAPRQYSWESEGAAKWRAAISHPLPMPCCKESARGMQKRKRG